MKCTYSKFYLELRHDDLVEDHAVDEDEDPGTPIQQHKQECNSLNKMKMMMMIMMKMMMMRMMMAIVKMKMKIPELPLNKTNGNATP